MLMSPHVACAADVLAAFNAPSEEATAQLRQLWQQRRGQAIAGFMQTRRPFTCLSQLSALADETLAAIWQHCCNQHTTPRWCLVATGGYGRKELYPHSDLDIMLLHEGDEAALAQPLRALLNQLWDLQLKVGHACRSLSDCQRLMQHDQTIRTALLDARMIAGDANLFQKLTNLIKMEFQPTEKKWFLGEKLSERQSRLNKYGRSQFLLEPNVKDNAGGLRDLHIIYWLARSHYGVRRMSELVRLGVLSTGEYRRFRSCHEFMATVRLWLHQQTSRADERLTFDRQQEIAAWLDYRHSNANKPVERFMKQYFHNTKQINQLTDLFTAILEDEILPPSKGILSRLKRNNAMLKGFRIDHRRLNFTDDMRIHLEPILMLKLFAVAQEHQLEIHPRALRQIARNLVCIDALFRENPEANELFLNILLSLNAPDKILSRMNECGFLGKFIPDFGRLVGQIQFDRYHIFTVDEHTIRLIGQLHQMQTGGLRETLPLASDVIHQIASKRALFLAALCHDMAKGQGGDHASKGAAITHKLGKRFGLSGGEIALAVWLVRQHLLFSHTAFSRDLDDPQTLIDFTQAVQSPERLKCLLLLTVADIRAVGPGIWNGWKGALMRDLFARAEAGLGAPERFDISRAIGQHQQQLKARLNDWPSSLRERLMSEPTPAFWLNLPSEHHASVAALLRQTWDDKTLIACSFQTHSLDAITHLQLCIPDHEALLHYFAGCITHIGGSIVSIKSVTLQGGTAILLADLQDKRGGAYENTQQLKRLPALLTNAATAPEQLAAEVEKRRPKSTARSRALEVPVEIYLDNHLSHTQTVIEIGATDRIGLLYDITAVLTRLGLTILSSHITTYGEKAVDVFYVQNVMGQKIITGDRITVIRRELLAMLGHEIGDVK